MSKVQTLRAFIEQRLTAAAEEIFGVFERTISEYEEELCRQQKLLNAVFKPEVRLHRADVQQLLPRKEEPEELLTNQEGEQLQDVIKFRSFRFSPVPVKSEEEHKVKLQFSRACQTQTEQIKIERDREDCGGPEPHRNSEPDRHLRPAVPEKTSDSSEPETDDSCDWGETSKPQSGLSSLQNIKASELDVDCNTASSECTAGFGGMNLSSCGICGSRFSSEKSLMSHMKLHTDGKKLSCLVCNRSYSLRSSLAEHMQTHCVEKPLSCTVCGKRFRFKSMLRQHMNGHAGKKPFSCSLCDRRFAWKSHLQYHLSVHSGEKPFGCSVCGKRFIQRSSLHRHQTVHTKEKPFSCSGCDQRFTCAACLKSHTCVGVINGGV